MAGGGLGRWPAVAIVLIAASLAVVFPMISAATSHEVGGSTGWTIPPNSTFYSSWSASQKFAVGDTLVFNFPTGAHTVVEVPKSSYDACSTLNQVGPTQSAGPATVTITSGEEHYYICSVTRHCSLNQKLSIKASGSSPAPSIPKTLPVPGDSPGSASSPAPPPTDGSSPGSSAPGGGSAAPPASTLRFAAAAVAGLFLAVALW